jgi:hypothetical protein
MSATLLHLKMKIQLSRGILIPVFKNFDADSCNHSHIRSLTIIFQGMTNGNWFLNELSLTFGLKRTKNVQKTLLILSTDSNLNMNS